MRQVEDLASKLEKAEKEIGTSSRGAAGFSSKKKEDRELSKLTQDRCVNSL